MSVKRFGLGLLVFTCSWLSLTGCDPGSSGSSGSTNSKASSRIYFTARTASTSACKYYDEKTGSVGSITHANLDTSQNGYCMGAYVYKKLVFFNALDTSGFVNLFIHDTETDTVQYEAINTSADAWAIGFEAINDVLYFSAVKNGVGRELFKFDTTTKTVSLISDIISGASSGNPTEMLKAGSKLYFTANNGTAGMEPWVYDSSNNSVNMIQDYRAGASNSYPQKLSLSADGTHLYFMANGSGSFSAHKMDLSTQTITSFGTTGGTWGGSGLLLTGNYLVHGNSDASPSIYSLLTSAGTLAAGTATTSSTGFIEFNGSVYFSATSAATGAELFKLVPSTGSVSLAYDFNSGAGGSSSYAIKVVSSKLLVYADNGTSGTELYTISTSDVPTQITGIGSVPDYVTSGQTAFLGTKMYFIGQSGSNKNLYSYNVSSGEATQLTSTGDLHELDLFAVSE